MWVCMCECECVGMWVCMCECECVGMWVCMCECVCLWDCVCVFSSCGDCEGYRLHTKHVHMQNRLIFSPKHY